MTRHSQAFVCTVALLFGAGTSGAQSPAWPCSVEALDSAPVRQLVQERRVLKDKTRVPFVGDRRDPPPPRPTCQ